MAPRRCPLCSIDYDGYEQSHCQRCKLPWVPQSKSASGNSWNVGYCGLKEYISTYGKDLSHIDGSYVYWLIDQRDAIRRDAMRSDRLKKLQDLGFFCGDRIRSEIREEEQESILDLNEGVPPDAMSIVNSALQARLDSMFRAREDELKKKEQNVTDMKDGLALIGDKRKMEAEELKNEWTLYHRKKKKQEQLESDLTSRLEAVGEKENALSARDSILSVKESEYQRRASSLTDKEKIMNSERDKMMKDIKDMKDITDRLTSSIRRWS